jgi:hypothetical protein
MTQPYPGDKIFADIGDMLVADFRSADRTLDHVQITQWLGRILWDILIREMEQSAAIMKHRKVWRETLGLPGL